VLYRVGEACSSGRCIAVVHSPQCDGSDNSSTSDQLMSPIQHSCETADVVVVDDVPLSAVDAAEAHLSQYRSLHLLLSVLYSVTD